MNYQEQHAAWANTHQPVKNRRVLVIGCNTGLDCSFFVNFGAAEVHGLDVVEEIGQDYTHPCVTYHRMSAEDISLPSDHFDLVFAVATLEHVPDVTKAFAEMARVTKPGGLIYSLASPLWNSPHGHHLPQFFADTPWAHLIMTESEAAAHIKSQWPNGTELGSPESVASYMYDAANFNRTRSEVYVEACSTLKGFDFLRNDIDRLPPETVPQRLAIDLAAKGYDVNELTAVTHTLIARKLVKQHWWKRLLAKFCRRYGVQRLNMP